MKDAEKGHGIVESLTIQKKNGNKHKGLQQLKDSKLLHFPKQPTENQHGS